MMDYRDLFVLENERVEKYRMQHKTCILSILFTDIVGYTKLCEKLPAQEVTQIRHGFEDMAYKYLEATHGGLILKFVGDAVIAVFAEPFSAVQAALELKQEISSISNIKDKIKLRTGIHMGAVALESKGVQFDIFGKHVNRASRIQTACMPGEILVSEPVKENVAGFCLTEHKFTPHFIRRRLILAKNIDEPLQVYTVVPGSMPDQTESDLENAFIKIRLECCNSAWNDDEVQTTIYDSMHTRCILIGRDEICDIQIDADRVSRRHAFINFNYAGKWCIQDNQSLNGTLLNGKHISLAELAIGDCITISDYSLIVEDYCTDHPDHLRGTKLSTL